MKYFLIQILLIVTGCSTYDYLHVYNPVSTSNWKNFGDNGVKQSCDLYDIEVKNIELSSKSILMAFAGIPYFPVLYSPTRKREAPYSLLMFVSGRYPERICEQSSLNLVVLGEESQLSKISADSHRWETGELGITCSFEISYDLYNIQSTFLELNLPENDCVESSLALKKTSEFDYTMVLVQ